MKFIPKKLLVVLTAILLSGIVCTGQGPAPQASNSFRTQVEAISAGADSAGRAAAITRRLDELGIKYRRETFVRGERQGTNIIVELPRSPGQKELMLGAHLDRVALGAGAIDNASGSAVVLELLAALKAKPLKNHALTAVFFDLEEVGLVGSLKYIEARKPEALPVVMVNFDVFGYGDTLWVGASDPKTAAATAVARAASAGKFPLEIGPSYPSSDHLSFRKAGIEALSFSLIDGKEIPGILQIFRRERPEVTPRVLTIIHSSGDTNDKIDALGVMRALPVVEQSIRAIDAP